MYLFNSFEVKSIVNGQLVCPDPVCNPVGMKNWMYNDNYVQMLITANISENIMVHTDGCPTAFNMWQTLRALFKRSPNMDYTEQLHTIFENCAYKGSNIVDHLMKLKSDWNNILIHLNPHSLQADALFKHIIASTLLCSWDAFTQPYVQGAIDQADKDLNKHVDSQSLIGMISQEYEVIENCKKKDSSNTKNNNANANANGNANSKVNDSRCPPHNKKHCNVCGKDSHKTDDCHYKDMDLCNECKKYGHLTKECWGKDRKKHPYKGKEKENNKRKKESHNAETEDEKEAQTNNIQVQTGKFKKGDDITLLAEEKNDVDDEDSNMAAIDNYGTIASSSKMTDSLYYWLADLGTTSHITH